jgi:micrococcal nuclease
MHMILKTRISLLTMVVFAGLVVLSTAVLTTDNATAAKKSETRPATVTSISDGDTFKVKLGDKTEIVRIVGVNTPELKECYGPEAAAAMRQLVSGKRVWLETDVQQGNKDKYGRLLRFVWLDDRTSVNKKLLSEGHGYEVLYSKKAHAYRSSYILAQTEAKNAGRGLWAVNTCAGKRSKPVAVTSTQSPSPASVTQPRPAAAAPTPRPQPVAAPAPAPTPAPAANAVYYGTCADVRAAGAAPIYPGQAGFRQSFDRDNDGVGCE